MSDKTDLDNLVEKKLDEPRLRELREKEKRESLRESTIKNKEIISNLMNEDNIIERVEGIVEWMNKNLHGSFKISKSKFFIYSDRYSKHYNMVLQNDAVWYELVISKRYFLLYKKTIVIEIFLSDEWSNLYHKQSLKYGDGRWTDELDELANSPAGLKKILEFKFQVNYLLRQGLYSSMTGHLGTEEFFDTFKDFLVEIKTM